VADFTPTWVLVVTYVNLAADEGCRYQNLYRKLDWWWWSVDHSCTSKAFNIQVRHFLNIPAQHIKQNVSK